MCIRNWFDARKRNYFLKIWIFFNKIVNKVPHTHIIEIGNTIDRKESYHIQIDNFMNLIKSGFDVSFNYKDVFYTISLIDENESGKKYGIGSDNNFTADFDTFESIPDFVLDDKKIKDIVADLKDEEIFF